jgi:hypothetical protein
VTAVYHVASLAVSEPVDGTREPRRRRPRRASRRLAVTTRDVVADKRVMRAARAAMRPGQRLVIVSATVVRLVNA